MTSRVVVSAHCVDSKQVQIVLSGAWNGETKEEMTTTIENGEVKELVFYDDMMISVREIEK